MNHTLRMMISSRLVAVAARAFVVAVLASAVTASAIAAGPTRGRVPAEAFRPDGSIDHALVPDYIVAVGTVGDEPVGFVLKKHVMPEDGAPLLEIVPVFGDDLKTVVGHMYPGIGFVPLGGNPRDFEPAFAPELWESSAAEGEEALAND